MPISFRCGSCLKVLSAKDEIAGKAVHCPKCKALLEVPASTAPLEEDVDLQPEEVEAPPPSGVIPRAQAQRMTPTTMELRDDDSESQPRRKSSSSLRRSSVTGRPAFRRKKSDSQTIPLLLLCCGLMVLATVVLVIWIVRFQDSTLANRIPSGWREFHGEGFTCWIPESIEFTRVPDAGPQFRRLGSTATMYTSKYPTQYSVFTVKLNDSDRAALRLNDAEFRRQMAERTQRRLGGELVTGRAVDVDGRPGYEIEIQMPEGTFLLRLTIHDDIAIIQTFSIPEPCSFDDPRARPFFDSFRITR